MRTRRHGRVYHSTPLPGGRETDGPLPAPFLLAISAGLEACQRPEFHQKGGLASGLNCLELLGTSGGTASFAVPPPPHRAAGPGAAAGTRGRAPPALLTLQGSVQVGTRDSRLHPHGPVTMRPGSCCVVAGPASSSPHTGRHRASRGAGAAAGARPGPGPGLAASGTCSLLRPGGAAHSLSPSAGLRADRPHPRSVQSRSGQDNTFPSQSQPEDAGQKHCPAWDKGSTWRRGHHDGSHRIRIKRQGSQAATGAQQEMRLAGPGKLLGHREKRSARLESQLRSPPPGGSPPRPDRPGA